METRLIFGMVFLYFQAHWGFIYGVPARQCGTFVQKPPREAKIVGGSDCFEGEFPWMVSLKSKIGHFCGGFIISDQHVLSAAHCFLQSANRYIDYVDGKVVLSSLNVTIGEYSLKSPEHTKDITVSIQELIVHPNYNPLTKDNDIALIKLKEKISIHPVAEAVCLPGLRSMNKGTTTYEKAVAAGWGKTDMYQDSSYVILGFDGFMFSKHTSISFDIGGPYWYRMVKNVKFYEWDEKVDKLKKVEVKIWDTEKCRNVYKGFGKFPTKSFICAGQKGKDSCTGDSGGPLLYLEGKKWTAIGVVSVGNKCGEMGRPGVYTNIADFVGWIDANSK